MERWHRENNTLWRRFVRGLANSSMKDVHTALDTVGFIPGFGEFFDLANAGLYAIEGDWTNAAISATAMFPIVGDFGKAGRLGAKFGKYVNKTKILTRTRKASADLATNAVAKNTSKSSFRGGAHGDTKLPWKDGLESHHMPAKSINGLHPDKGPAIQMKRRDHIFTSSHSHMQGNGVYRAEIKTLLDSGRMRDAMAREIRDVRRAAQTGSGNAKKYNGAIREMLEYARKSGLL